MEGEIARLTVVIPAYNEAPVIGQVVRAALEDIVLRLPGAQLLVVDDGSTDRTAEAVAAAAGTAAVECLRLERNLGQGPAVHRAFAASRGEWICQMDGDGQVETADFWKLWDRRHEADLLLGVRRSRADPAHRRVLTRMVRGVTRLASGGRLEDAAAPLRLIRRSTWDDVGAFVDDRALSLSILVSVAAVRRGWRVSEIPVRHRARPYGRSRLRGVTLLAFVARACVELAALMLRLRSAQRAHVAAASRA